MLQITSQAADSIFSWSNIILLLGTVMVLIGTIGVVWSGGIRDKFADERISRNEAETARAKAETAQALLEQERLKQVMAWRRVTPQQAHLLSLTMKDAPHEFWLSWVGNDPEATVFRQDLDAALTAAGIKTKYFSGYARAVGLSVGGGTPEERQRLIRAFHAAGLPLENSGEEGHGKGPNLQILVGTKPPPDFVH